MDVGLLDLMEETWIFTGNKLRQQIFDHYSFEETPTIFQLYYSFLVHMRTSMLERQLKDIITQYRFYTRYVYISTYCNDQTEPGYFSPIEPALYPEKAGLSLRAALLRVLLSFDNPSSATHCY